MKKKYIISGPAGSGKSTLIAALQKSGFDCLQEVSRAVISLEQTLGNDGMPWKNIDRFSHLVFNETIKKLHTTAQNTVFCDRSLIDNIAYLEHLNKLVFDELLAFDFDKYYHKTVFFALPWFEIYEQDPQRPEIFEFQIPLSNTLLAVYKRYGFEIIFLPFSTVNLRVAYVLDTLKILENRTELVAL